LKSSFNSILKNISAFEVIAIFAFIIGIVWAIYVDTMAPRAIALCVAFFAIVALINSLVQKASYRVETGKFTIKSSERFVTNTVKDEKATHTTIDNFEQIHTSSNTQTGVNYNDDEGFVIVNRTTNTSEQQTITPKNKREYTVDFGAEDVSSFRIITHSATAAAASKSTDASSHSPLFAEVPRDETKDHHCEQSEAIHTIKTEIATHSANARNDSETTEKNVVKTEENSVCHTALDTGTPNIDRHPELVSGSSNEILKQVQNDSEEICNDSEETNENKTTEESRSKIAKSDFASNNQPFMAAVALEMDLPVSLIADLDKKMDNSISEFGYLISRFLVIINSVLEANTVAFIWVNNEKKTLLFDSYLSDNNVKDLIITDKKIKFGNDVISQIVANSKPQILSQINPVAELDLIPYYVKPAGTTSFIGIPIIFENTVVGVLCADSNQQDAYDKATVAFLGLFTKIFSALFGSYSNNYSNENATKTLMLLNQFTGLVAKKGCSFNQICSAVIDFIVELYDCSSLGICYYSDAQKAWAVCAYKSIKNVDENFFTASVSLENSLIGMSISDCKIISLAKVPQNYTRVNQFEPQDENVSFISIPIKSVTDTYGALFIEANDNGLLNSTVDFEILKAMCNHAGEILEKMQLVTLFNDFVSIETHSGILTESTFKKRISQEVLRANEDKQTISLALISLDKYSSAEDASKKTKIFDYIISIANQQLKPFEIIGRVKNDVIGVVMINRDQMQSKLALERIRQQIATQYIDFFDDRLVVTVSIGVAAIRPNDTFETFTSNATVALYQAQKRTNCVQIFE